MSDEKLSPERAIRLLRAKGAELENYVLNASAIPEMRDEQGDIINLSADIALIAQLLADHIERSEEDYHAWQRLTEAPTVYSEGHRSTLNRLADMAEGESDG